MIDVEYFLTYDECCDLSLGCFRELLVSSGGKRLADVTIADLCVMSEFPNGIYFYFDSKCGELQYCGKCTSRSFIERIPAHFDPRENAWFNTVPAKMAKTGMPYQEALDRALELRVVMLGIKDDVAAKKLEKVIRHTFQPVLNTPANPDPVSEDLTISQVVSD